MEKVIPDLNTLLKFSSWFVFYHVYQILTFFKVKSLGRSVSSISLSPRCWLVWTEDLNPSKTPLKVNFFILVLATFHNSFSFFGSMMTNFIWYLQHLHKTCISVSRWCFFVRERCLCASPAKWWALLYKYRLISVNIFFLFFYCYSFSFRESVFCSNDASWFFRLLYSHWGGMCGIVLF